jgi:SAM-dependent methyltransferase
MLTFRDKNYPDFIATGNHARYILPVAKEVLVSKINGIGVDVGSKNPAWAFPGAKPVDTSFDDGYHALYLPNFGKLDYIFSSHCLEHIHGWQFVLRYWYDALVKSGMLFLYLPHKDNEYWNVDFMPTKRHINDFKPEVVHYELEQIGFKNVFSSQRDAAYSFCVYGEK